VDAGGALRVGPRSAGAVPGPACYGRGGEDAAVTDANLLLGYLADGSRLGGEIVLDRSASEAALARLAAVAGMDSLGAALGVVQVANAEMVRALRVISIERGLDPRDFVLVAFGGAGPMHACALAEDLGMKTVLVPKASGVLSALGLSISDLRRDYVAPFLTRLDDVADQELETVFRSLESAGRGDLGDPAFVRRADIRYRGQSFELTVDAGDLPSLASEFRATHKRRYGYVMDTEPLEVVNLRLVATVAVAKPPIREEPAGFPEAPRRRRANFDGAWTMVQVLDRTAMGAGTSVEGPALVEFPEATCVVRPGWVGVVDGGGTLVLERR
jgi:N-methylhydantoinase A